MDQDLAGFLANRTPAATEPVVWGERLRLVATAYLTADAPPLRYVTSVRAVVLRAEIDQGKARLAEIEAESQSRRRVVEQAYAMLRALGLEPEPEVPPHRESEPQPGRVIPVASPNGGRQKPAARTEFVAGNKGEKTPPRRPEYATMSLTSAATRLLASGEVLSLDDLTDSIYDVRDSKGRQAAKNSLRSTLANGVKDKRWTRVADGVFRAVPQGANAMMT
jgi:hypothetical protein